MTKEDKVHDPALPRWVFIIALTLISSTITGLYVNKSDRSELMAVKEMTVENKQDIKALTQCVGKVENTMTRLETILLRLEKKVDQ